MHRKNRVLLFDFDGTISLGDGPVRRYAECAADALPPVRRESFLEAVARQKASPSHAEAGPSAAEPLDGYDAVRRAAGAFSISADALERAYRRSRAELASPEAPIDAVPGLAAFLGGLRADTYLVLATNSPATRIPEALRVLELQDCFDEVITSVGKPSGLGVVLDGLQHAAADPAFRLLSLGDVWVNDLEPAFLRGFETALIGSQTPLGATPTYRAERLDALFPVITAWLSAESSLIGPRSDIPD